MLVVVVVLILGFFCSSSHAFTHNNNQHTPQQQRQHTHISAVQIEESHRTTRQHTLEKKKQQNDQASQLDELFQRTPPHVVEVLPEPIPSRIEIRCDTDGSSSSSEERSDDAARNKAEDNAGTEAAEEEDNDQDEDDNELVDEIQERRKLAARAALLGRSRRGPTTTRKAGATTQRKQSNKASTSVGARRVGSATKARQGPGVTKRFMDAVRKSATTANPKQTDDDKENPSETKPPSSVLNNKRTLSPSALHERVLELMETKKRAGYTAAATSTTNTQSQGPRPFLPRRYTTTTQPASPLELFPTNKPKQQSDEQSPAAGTVLVPPSAQVTTTTTTTDSNKSNNNNNHKLQFPECLTVRVATTRSDTEVANLRLSVFSDFTPDVRRQLVSRSVRAVVTRRALGATCLIATVPPSLAARKRNRPPVILGSAECSFHEFEGTTLGRCRPTGSILYITEVAVSPNARRRGIGGKLLEAIDVLGNTREIETLYLHVDVENTGALALYEKAGFRKVDRSDPMFLEFTTKLNLHDGATKGRNHFLLYKNLVQCPTWLPESTTVPVVPAEFPQPPSGTLGFEVPC